MAPCLRKASLTTQGDRNVSVQPFAYGVVLCLLSFLQHVDWSARGIYTKATGDRSQKLESALQNDQGAHGSYGAAG